MKSFLASTFCVSLVSYSQILDFVVAKGLPTENPNNNSGNNNINYNDNDKSKNNVNNIDINYNNENGIVRRGGPDNEFNSAFCFDATAELDSYIIVDLSPGTSCYTGSRSSCLKFDKYWDCKDYMTENDGDVYAKGFLSCSTAELEDSNSWCYYAGGDNVNSGDQTEESSSDTWDGTKCTPSKDKNATYYPDYIIVKGKKCYEGDDMVDSCLSFATKDDCLDYTSKNKAIDTW
eukprot:Awhi_evm1s11308